MLVALQNQANLTIVSGFFQTKAPALLFDLPDDADLPTVRYEIRRAGVIIYDVTGTPPPADLFQDADGDFVEGNYTVRVFIAGPTEQSSELNFVVDATAPVGTPTLALTSDTGTSDSDNLTNLGDISLAPGDLGPGETITYSILTNGTPQIFTTLADLNAAINTLVPAGSPPTDVIIRAYKTDAAGNAGTESSFTITIDREPPPPPSVVPTGSNEAVTVSIVPGATNYFSYRLATADPADPLSWSAPSTTPPSGLADGDYVIRVYTEDTAGNRSTNADANVTVDRIASLDNPTGLDLAVDTGTSATDNISQEAAIVFVIDDGATAQFLYPGETEWRDAQRADLADGTYTVKVRQVTKDEDGNVTAVSDGVEITFTVDTTAEALVLPATIDLAVWRALDAFDLNYRNYEAGARIEFSLDGIDWDSVRPGDELKVGDKIYIRQVDIAGNESDADIVTLTGVPDAINPILAADPYSFGSNSGLY
jgi:hypothetical protein